MRENIPINEVIREKRIKEGIKLEEVFDETHIPIKFLRMIEDGNWEKFPSQLHMKGFIRLYGKYMDIPAAVIEEGINKITETKRDNEQQKDNQDKEEISEEKRELAEIPARYLCLLFFLIILFVFIYFLTLYFLPE
ncbi:MAG: helix-turn-helix domain-containing protein [bacterium]|nr:helix-turn-helix domain-containing protein [bacterium]